MRALCVLLAPVISFTARLLMTCVNCTVSSRLFSSVDPTAAGWLKTVTTNADGRCDRPLLEGDALVPGIYEITFVVAPYFARSGVALPEPPFVGDVVLRFGVADGSQHYHVPLLVTPWSYSTYRGS
jgi:5-hydroxyisourate hydrolase